MSTTIVFRVAGEPRTNERARHGAGRTYTPAKTRLARAEVTQAFQDAAPNWKPWEGPVALSLDVAHATAEKDRWEGRFCRRKPDLDNVAKLVSDALNGVAYLDDAQIVQMEAVKRYAATSGIEVRLIFSEPVAKPKHGWEKTSEGLWRLWRMGRHFGWVIKGGRAYAASPQQAEPDGLSFYSMGTYRTLAEAKARMEATLL
jgi:crossover junction endodeoxyribonuclease RusA